MSKNRTVYRRSDDKRENKSNGTRRVFSVFDTQGRKRHPSSNGVKNVGVV